MGALALLGFYLGGIWTFAFPFFTFGFIPLLELVLQPDPINLDPEMMKERKDQQVFEFIALSAVPVQYILLIAYLYRVTYTSFSTLEWVGMTLSMGVACGAFGINVAHELGHRSKVATKLGAKLLLYSSLYLHFFIEHNRGHHVNVATDEDPASAKLGESVYVFWIRSLFGGMRSAWHIEAKRLARRDQGPWTWKNEALRYYSYELIGLVTVGIFCGLTTLASWILVALIGALLLETVNYIEHYGLRRNKRENGRGYEAVMPIHSWNSDHIISRMVLFELSRHSDHHAHPRRPYSTLRSYEGSLQLPTGYPGMILFSLLPWFFIPYMENYIKHEQVRVTKLNATNS